MSNNITEEMKTNNKVYIVIYNKSSRYGFGEPLQILYETTEDVARMICQDDRTKGQSYFLGWTKKKNQKIKWVKDDGRFDELFGELGIKREGRKLILTKNLT